MVADRSPARRRHPESPPPALGAVQGGAAASLELAEGEKEFRSAGAHRQAADIRAALERVEELERSFGPLDQAATDYRRSRDTAEAKLARCVEAGGHLRGFAAGTDLGRAYIEDWDAALAAAKGE